MDKRHCSGCKDNIYNWGEDPAKTRKCWLLDSATLIKRQPVPVEAKPPFRQKAVKLPDCYYRAGWVHFNV